MPETRSNEIEMDAREILDHWALNDESRTKLAKHAKELHVDLLDPDTCLDVLGFERNQLHKFPGTLDQAMRRVTDWALGRELGLIDKLRFPDPEHREAKAIAWTTMIAPDGTQVNVTAREGASADMVAATVLALTGAARLLDELGYVTQKTRR